MSPSKPPAVGLSGIYEATTFFVSLLGTGQGGHSLGAGGYRSVGELS